MANIDTIRGVYEAFAARNIPALLGAMAPDMVWNEAENFPYADNNPYVGPDAVLKGVFMRIGAEWDGFAVKPEELIDGGDTIVMTGRYAGIYKATGKSMSPQVVHVWKFKAGKVVSFQQYIDTLDVSRAISG